MRFVYNQYKTYIHFAIRRFAADALEPAGMRTSLSNTLALDLPSSPLNPAAAGPGPLVLSPRLHNKDLAPTKVEGRRWGRYSIFALWTNDVHNIANYSFEIGRAHV